MIKKKLLEREINFESEQDLAEITKIVLKELKK